MINGMKTTIDSAGRLVIPKEIRQQAAPIRRENPQVDGEGHRDEPEGVQALGGGVRGGRGRHDEDGGHDRQRGGDH